MTFLNGLNFWEQLLFLGLAAMGVTALGLCILYQFGFFDLDRMVDGRYPATKDQESRYVGCSRPDGTLNVHLESTTCEVCRSPHPREKP